jgi:predicted SAM-dependent methyltransferase
MNWGCGRSSVYGWINCDRAYHDGVDILSDALHGLPLSSDSLDYIVTVHALSEIPFHAMTQVLSEMRRVLKPSGVIRIAAPDLLKGVEAYRRGDREYFKVPDEDAKSLGGKLVVQLMWYSFVRMLFTFDSLEEQLQKAGFRNVRECPYQQTGSRFPEITSLDNREAETLFVEAEK